jgi:hypothetical protein
MTPLKPYPTNIPKTLDGVWNSLLQITRLRAQDVAIIGNLPNQFILGRKVNTIPGSSTVAAGDQVGDYNITTTFGYACVDDAGTAKWVQWTVGTF